MDFLSKTDCFLVLYESKDFNKWKEVGRTEIIEDNLEPEFLKTIDFWFKFESKQQVISWL